MSTPGAINAITRQSANGNNSPVMIVNKMALEGDFETCARHHRRYTMRRLATAEVEAPKSMPSRKEAIRDGSAIDDVFRIGISASGTRRRPLGGAAPVFFSDDLPVAGSMFSLSSDGATRNEYCESMWQKQGGSRKTKNAMSGKKSKHHNQTQAINEDEDESKNLFDNSESHKNTNEETTKTKTDNEKYEKKKRRAIQKNGTSRSSSEVPNSRFNSTRKQWRRRKLNHNIIYIRYDRM
jgi:hypothetical protein